MEYVDRPWRELSREEAEAYLERFLAEQSERIHELTKLSESSGGPTREQLDYSPDSLVPLWQWARRRLAWHVSYVRAPRPGLPPQQQPKDDELPPLSELPTWVGAVSGVRRRFSADTLWLIDMMTRYFAEVLLRANPHSEWRVGHSRIKGYAEENQPVLSWGSDVLNPLTLVRVVASRELDDDSDVPGGEGLRDTFDTWMEILGRATADHTGASDLELTDLFDVDEYDPEGEWTYDIYLDDWFAGVGEDHVKRLIVDLSGDARVVEVHHEDREHLLVNAPDLTLDTLRDLVARWLDGHADEIRQTIELD